MYKFIKISTVLLMLLFSVTSFAVEPYLNTQLLEASSRGDTKVVKDSLLNGANVDARDRLGNTALILASDAGYQDIVRLLIENKASINAVNKFGYTPLMSAVTNSHRYIASLLIKAGADPKLPNKFGTTPEMYIKAQGFFTMSEYIGDEEPAMSTQVDDRPSRRGSMAGIHNAPWREEFNQLIALGKTKEAAELLIGYANTNNYEAAYLLGTLFISKGNLEQGVHWLKKAASSNDDYMKYRVAKSIIDNGNGFGIKDAVVILKQSIAKGNNFAKTEYAKLLLFGQGVPKDNANAYALFSDAAANEVPEAIYYKGFLQYIGRGTVQDEEKGLAEIQTAADLGFHEAGDFIEKVNARKNMTIIANSKVTDRSTIKAFLISMGAPINIDNPSCDVYTLGNAWNNAYNISKVEVCYPGDGTAKSKFIITGHIDPSELRFLQNEIAGAEFVIASDNKNDNIDDSFIPKKEEKKNPAVLPKGNIDIDKPASIKQVEDDNEQIETPKSEEISKNEETVKVEEKDNKKDSKKNKKNKSKEK